MVCYKQMLSYVLLNAYSPNLYFYLYKHSSGYAAQHIYTQTNIHYAGGNDLPHT